MDNKFLDKVCDQIVSETRVIDNKLHTPLNSSSLFSFSLSFLSPFPPPIALLSPSYNFFLSLFFSHCKEVYSLNKEETDYVWNEYKKGVTALMEDKEPSHQEKG
jgi:hypothetical protein